jgi:hypothetical protein
MCLKGRHTKELVMKYVSPGHLDSIVSVQPRYENFIGTRPLGLF